MNDLPIDVYLKMKMPTFAVALSLPQSGILQLCENGYEKVKSDWFGDKLGEI